MSARAALFIKNRLDLFLSSCQFGNTLAAPCRRGDGAGGGDAFDAADVVRCI